MDSRLYRIATHQSIKVHQRGNSVVDIGGDELDIFQQFTGLGNSVLHIALSRGNLRFIEKLLEMVNGDSVAGREFLRAKNLDGNSALHLAALYGHHKLVEELIRPMKGDTEEGGEYLRCVNGEGNTALHQAAHGGDDKVVEVLLKRDGGLISEANAAGETAVFVASQWGHTEIVDRLLKIMDSDSNMERNDGQTPLHSAVFYGHTGVVKKLLQHRPDLAKQTDGCGRTAMHMLVLYSPVPGFIRLSMKQLSHYRKIAKYLLKKDNSLCYKKDNEGKAPLHMAVEWERQDLVGILLTYGGDCREATDNEGRKPLHLAVVNAVRSFQTINFVELFGFKSMLFSLMSSGSLNHRDNRGRTPLHIAMENIEKDAALYRSITNVLRSNGALLTPDILEYAGGMKVSPTKLMANAAHISINAVLIATVSFAAAFTLPGGLSQVSHPGEEPRAVFINAFLFKLFMICDTLSFCTAIASTILVQFSGAGDQQDQSLVLISVNLLWYALMSLVVAFGAAVHLVIAPSPWLAGIVWTMLCLVLPGLYVVLLRSKYFIFIPERSKIWNGLLLLFPFSIIFWTFWIIGNILNVFLFTGLFYVWHWIKKLIKRRH